MLNRRILRIKVFKVLFACVQTEGISVKEALSMLDDACESTRDLYLFLLSIVTPLTAQARSRIEAARSKFNPTEEDLNPNMKFADNALASLLERDIDFSDLIAEKNLNWDNCDVLIRNLYDSIVSEKWFKDYMNAPGRSLGEDIELFEHIFEEKLEDNEDLLPVLEEKSIWWPDECGYALMCCLRSLEDIAKKGRWNYPNLYAKDEDYTFIKRLLQVTLDKWSVYYDTISASAKGWDSDRLFLSDMVLIAMGLAEQEFFPEIPRSVTINEYVELAKYYSTPKSRVFVNGLLDRLIPKKINQ